MDNISSPPNELYKRPCSDVSSLEIPFISTPSNTTPLNIYSARNKMITKKSKLRSRSNFAFRIAEKKYPKDSNLLRKFSLIIPQFLYFDLNTYQKTTPIKS